MPAITVTKSHVRKLKKLQAHLVAHQKRPGGGFVLDSGATTTMVKNKRWLGKLLMRMKVTMRDAAGGSHPTGGSGKLGVRFIANDGSFYNLTNLGNGTLVHGLMYNLLSVSQLCSHGFTVVFKQNGSRIVTPDGVVIPVNYEKGLYVLPAEVLPQRFSTGTALRAVKCSDGEVADESQAMRRFYGKLITDPNVQHGMIGNLERMSGAFRGDPGSKADVRAGPALALWP